MSKKRVVGAPVLPSSNDFNGCNTVSGSKSPAKSPANPNECYTGRTPNTTICNKCGALMRNGLCTREDACLDERVWLGRTHIGRLARPVIEPEPYDRDGYTSGSDGW